MSGPSSPSAGEAPGAWVRLVEGPFEGEWIGLTADWAERLPCDVAELGWVRLWVCLSSPNESALASSLFERLSQLSRAQSP